PSSRAGPYLARAPSFPASTLGNTPVSHIEWFDLSFKVKCTWVRGARFRAARAGEDYMQVRGASAGRAPGIITRSRRHAIWACVAVFLVLPAGPGLAQSLDFWPAVFSSSGFTVPVASGILYSHFKVGTAAGPLNVHHLSVDLSNPTVRAGAGLAHNRLMSDDETVSSMVARSGAIAGVNADFFHIHGSGMPLKHVRR